MLFGRSSKQPPVRYDPAKQKPAIRSSICSGEKVAGFIDTDTGRFTEVVMIPDGKALEAFKRQYGIQGEIETVY